MLYVMLICVEFLLGAVVIAITLRAIWRLDHAPDDYVQISVDHALRCLEEGNEARAVGWIRNAFDEARETLP